MAAYLATAHTLFRLRDQSQARNRHGIELYGASVWF